MDNKKANSFLKIVSFCAILTLPEFLYAQLLDKGFEYTYSLSKNGFTFAHVKRKLEVSSNNHIFSSHAYPVGFASIFTSNTITEQSIISNKNNTLILLSYSYLKKAENPKERFNLEFNWENNTVTDSRVTAPFKLASNTFDTLSFQLALANSLTKIQPALVFSLIDNKQIKTYKLEPGGKELIETDAGQFNTLKFSYYDEIKKRKVIIWCAKKLGYLPIQIKRIDSDGDYGELKIISLKPGEVTDLNTNDSENDNDF